MFVFFLCCLALDGSMLYLANDDLVFDDFKSRNRNYSRQATEEERLTMQRKTSRKARQLGTKNLIFIENDSNYLLHLLILRNDLIMIHCIIIYIFIIENDDAKEEETRTQLAKVNSLHFLQCTMMKKHKSLFAKPKKNMIKWFDDVGYSDDLNDQTKLLEIKYELDVTHYKKKFIDFQQKKASNSIFCINPGCVAIAHLQCSKQVGMKDVVNKQ